MSSCPMRKLNMWRQSSSELSWYMTLLITGISNTQTLTAIPNVVAKRRAWLQVSNGSNKNKPMTSNQFAVGPPTLIARNCSRELSSSLKLNIKNETGSFITGETDLVMRAPEKCPHS